MLFGRVDTMGLQSLLRALYHLGYSLLRSCQISDAERLAGGNLIVISDLGDLILEVGQPPTEELSPPLDVYPPEEAIDDPFHLEYIPGGWPEDASSFYSTTCVLAPSSGTASSNATLPSDIGEQSTTNADPNQGDPASDEQDVAHTHAQTEEAVEPAITHVRLLVSSTILATASPVFKTMLHGRFAEALLSFSRANPPTIYLGDDDPSAMMEFCRVMHHAPGIYKEMTCKTMEGLAVLCDKYMCAHALRGWFRGHAYEFLSGNRLTHLDDTDFSSAKLLRVGYLINDRDLFSSASNTFIENVCPADTRATLEGVFGEYLPERLVG